MQPLTAADLPPLTWARFASSWSLEPVWLIVCATLATGYLVAFRTAAHQGRRLPLWRAVSFCAGTSTAWVVVASAVGGYSTSLFWMHMVMHLALIMLVPALLVLGRPLTVLVAATSAGADSGLAHALRGRLTGTLLSPAAGLVVYTLVVVGTHLTDFLDQVVVHPWLADGEQALYVVAGVLFLMPLLGDEPLRRDPSHLFRLGLLVVAMVPDTIVGIVLLQASAAPFPGMIAARPAWALDGLDDVHVGGALMWAGGDALMMAIAVALVIAIVTSPARRAHMIGPWLEGVRASTLSERSAFDSPPDDAASGPHAPVDADSDEAFEAYNAMLARLRGSEES
ncbi:cytochrome c oxidase assembly protein [Nocardioides acrostichi]|uniref:Cytochrome c oxidase assembly protein n=1 Tax=Nocardioides acrostichi TaxID=2784339 RepID=A0A930V3Z4_9ACTN|nr:cytochrome c oxidase assembly protein [Nocardioides acrostichi]MBF4163426.1 cytochrome c oxidase assembly protein [Nocardioides acrostichi]